VQELGAYDVNITVYNPPSDANNFQGELGDLLHWLGDAALGAGLVWYTKKFERHLIDSIEALRVALVDHS